MPAPDDERRRRRQCEAEQVHVLVAQGRSVADIERATGLGRGQISRRLTTARNGRMRVTAQQVRTDVAALLDDVIRMAQEQIDTGELDNSVLPSFLTVIADTAMNKARLFRMETVPPRESGQQGESDDDH
ncbi:hypothetical protein ACFXPT_10950 [Streptomyces goshikiensis]|uniref:hypothetical protein n=1 Tax=Streptomyces goshikiensis TaxID=1942 RepID=UPI0036A05A5D